MIRSGVNGMWRRRAPVSAAKALQRHRAERAVGNVVLTAPDELDRTFHRLRDPHRLDHVLVQRTPPETAAQVARMELDTTRANAQGRRGRVARAVGELGAGPNFGAVDRGIHVGHGVQRLHLRVVGMIAQVFRVLRSASLGSVVSSSTGTSIIRAAFSRSAARTWAPAMRSA